MVLCASMMCADYGNLDLEIAELERAGIDWLHVDIMDGNFVPNFGMGIQDLEYLCRRATVPVDLHLMIEQPGRYVRLFASLGPKVIYVHPEADMQPARTLLDIQEQGVRPGVAINPGTSVEQIRELLPLAEYVLLMSVNPGFAGQKYLDFIDEKLARLMELRTHYNFEVMVDGAISPGRLEALHKKGALGFVLGTSGLFGKGDYAASIRRLRALGAAS